MTYRYTLEPYKGPSSRHTCPACGAPRNFVRYIDTYTNHYLADDIGRCNRETSCGYHQKPSSLRSIADYAAPRIIRTKPKVLKPVPKEPSEMPLSAFYESLHTYGDNHLVRYLHSVLGSEAVNRVLQQYYVGTHHHWDCGTVFWRFDANGRLLSGKVMLYFPHTGRRVKKPCNHVTWMHKLLGMDNYRLQHCFFGEHLLHKNLRSPIAIVESEKTALIASALMPQYLWMATGGLSNLSPESCKVFANREVILYPDLGAYNAWAERARNIPNCTVSKLLEENATTEERLWGLDIADYMMR